MKRKKVHRPTRRQSKRLRQRQTAPSRSSDLISLPPELRTMIWELAVEESITQVVGLTHLPQPAITQVCRQIRQETMSLVVPALRDKKWGVPLLICFHCHEKYEPSRSIRKEYSTFCKHYEDDVRNWTIPPWLETLIEQSTMPLRTSNGVQFYRDSIPACGGMGRLVDPFGVHESRDSLRVHSRGCNDRCRVQEINWFTDLFLPRPTLDIAKVQSLVRAFHKPHFQQRLASHKRQSRSLLVTTFEDVSRHDPYIYRIRYKELCLPRWVDSSMAGEEIGAEKELEQEKTHDKSGLVASHRW